MLHKPTTRRSRSYDIGETPLSEIKREARKLFALNGKVIGTDGRRIYRSLRQCLQIEMEHAEARVGVDPDVAARAAAYWAEVSRP